MLKAWNKVMPMVLWQMLPPWMWQRTALGRGNPIAVKNDIPGVENHRLKFKFNEERLQPSDQDQRICLPVITSNVRDLTRLGLDAQW